MNLLFKRKCSSLQHFIKRRIECDENYNFEFKLKFKESLTSNYGSIIYKDSKPYINITSYKTILMQGNKVGEFKFNNFVNFSCNDDRILLTQVFKGNEYTVILDNDYDEFRIYYFKKYELVIASAIGEKKRVFIDNEIKVNINDINEIDAILSMFSVIVNQEISYSL